MDSETRGSNDRHEAELNLNLDVGFQFEALEVKVLLDIPEDSLETQDPPAEIRQTENSQIDQSEKISLMEG